MGGLNKKFFKIESLLHIEAQHPPVELHELLV
jgi:hypothetical protein